MLQGPGFDSSMGHFLHVILSCPSLSKQIKQKCCPEELTKTIEIKDKCIVALCWSTYRPTYYWKTTNIQLEIILICKDCQVVHDCTVTHCNILHNYTYINLWYFRYYLCVYRMCIYYLVRLMSPLEYGCYLSTLLKGNLRIPKHTSPSQQMC